jgi:hypothetical protein
VSYQTHNLASPSPFSLLLCRFQAPLGSPSLAFLKDHIIQGIPIMPGAGMVEAVAAAAGALMGGTQHMCLLQATIPAPLALASTPVPTLECHLRCDSGNVQLRTLSTSGSGGPADRRLHFRGHVSRHRGPEPLGSKCQVWSTAVRALLGSPPSSYGDVRCMAGIATGRHCRATGWAVHPGIGDTALQLGPATGDVAGKQDESGDRQVTRVVAGIDACRITDQVPSLAAAFCLACMTACCLVRLATVLN